MATLVKLAVSLLLTAVLALGNCAACFSLSAYESADEHSCCKPPETQPPCHSSRDPKPVQQQESCSEQADLLQSAHTVERLSLAPLFVAIDSSGQLPAISQDAGLSVIAVAGKSGPPLFPSFITPLRI